MPQLSKEELLTNDFSGQGGPVAVYDVKKIHIHEDFENSEDYFINDLAYSINDLAILTVEKPFDSKTQKGELQTKSVNPKSKVQSNLVMVNNAYTLRFKDFPTITAVSSQGSYAKPLCYGFP